MALWKKKRASSSFRENSLRIMCVVLFLFLGSVILRWTNKIARTTPSSLTLTFSKSCKLIRKPASHCRGSRTPQEMAPGQAEVQILTDAAKGRNPTVENLVVLVPWVAGRFAKFLASDGFRVTRYLLQSRIRNSSSETENDRASPELPFVYKFVYHLCWGTLEELHH